MPSIYPNTPIILASGSKSRRVMLEDAGIHFNVISSDVDEDLLKKEMDGFPFEDQVVKLAAAKASEVSINNLNHLVIGGDQMCIFQNKVFDKPGSQEKAIENLKLLSGTTHYQYSGVCLYKDGRSLWEYYEVVELNMHSLSEEENQKDLNKALSEAYRVLKPGGRFLCLEFSKIQNPNLDFFYKNYSKLIPFIGKVIVGKKEPYEYLIKSIEEFVHQDELISLMKKNGLDKCKYRNLSGGIVSIHSGWKII